MIIILNLLNINYNINYNINNNINNNVNNNNLISIIYFIIINNNYINMYKLY